MIVSAHHAISKIKVVECSGDRFDASGFNGRTMKQFASAIGPVYVYRALLTRAVA
jgi:hypothetical protein